MSQFGDAGRSIPPWSLLLPGWFCCASRDLSSVLPSGTTQFARRKQRRDTAMLSFLWLYPGCFGRPCWPFRGCIRGAVVINVAALLTTPVWVISFLLTTSPSRRIVSAFYLSSYKASTLIGGKHEGYNTEKADMVVLRLCFHQGN